MEKSATLIGLPKYYVLIQCNNVESCFALFYFSAQKRTNGLRRSPRQVDPGVFLIAYL